MAALSSDALLVAGAIFCFALALFLGACGLALFLSEPEHDPLSDRADGDWPQLPDDLKFRNHAERNTL